MNARAKIQAPAHVEGPWTVIDPQDGASYYKDSLEIHDGMGCTAVVMGDPYDPEIKATAALMAAAPDLLEAAKAMLASAEITDCPHGRWSTADPENYVRARKLRQAIAKAEAA